MNNLIDVVAARIGIWAIERLFKPLCKTHEDNCIDCQAQKIQGAMKSVLEKSK